MSAQPELLQQTTVPTDLEAMFNTSDYFDLSTLDTPVASSSTQLPTATTPGRSGMSGMSGFSTGMTPMSGNAHGGVNGLANGMNGNLGLTGFGGLTGLDGLGGLGEASAPFDRLETLTPDQPLGMDYMQGDGSFDMGLDMTNGQSGNGGLGDPSHSNGLSGQNGAAQSHGLSAATILSLLEEGSFDYASMFTDQAPLPMEEV